MSYEVDYDFCSSDIESRKTVLSRLASGKWTGIISNMPNDFYHDLGGYYSSTNLKKIYSSSPKHFKYDWDSTAVSEPTEAMLLGSAVHSSYLTPQLFSTEFRVVPKFDGRTKEGKLLKHELSIEKRGILTEPQFNKVVGMVRSAKADEKAERMRSECVSELAFFWECPFSDLMFKAKLDACGMGKFIEFKTCRDGSPDGFSKDSFNLNYDLSLVHYRMAIEQLCEDKPLVYVFAVENREPFVFQKYLASDEMFETGFAKWRDAVNRLSSCVNENKWPGYVDEEIEDMPMLYPPSWGMKQLGVEVKVEED